MKRLLACLLLLACITIPASAVSSYDHFNGFIQNHSVMDGSTPAELCDFVNSTGNTCTNIGLTHKFALGKEPGTYAVTSEETTNREWVNNWSWSTPTATHNNTVMLMYSFKLNGAAPAWNSVGWWRIINGTAAGPVSDFIGAPTSGTAPLTVGLNDNSTGTPLQWNWSASPSTGWYAAGGNLNVKNISLIFTAAGNYSITHGVSNSQGSDYEVKSNYIYIFTSNETTTTAFVPIDMRTGNVVYNAAVQLHDVENNSWSNTTDTSGGWAYITTLTDHHINAYAQASGYQDADLLNQIPAWGAPYAINMAPTGIINTTPGNLTFYVAVTDAQDLGPIDDAGVKVYFPSGAMQLMYTGANGVAAFTVPNNTALSVDVTALGYQGATKSYNTGSGIGGGSSSITLPISLWRIGVTPTQPNATPTPTITVCDENGCHPVTVAPTQTIPPECVQDPDSAACRGAYASGGLNLLSASLYDIIGFCIVMFFIYMVLGIGKAM